MLRVQTVPRAVSLSRRTKLVILALVVAQFLVGAGPVWRRPFDWDASILWSYATIPVLVAAALAWQQKLRWKSWFLDTVEITAVKFAVTATFLIAWLVSWQVRGGQRPPPQVPAAPVASEPRPARPPDTRPRAPRAASLAGTAPAGAMVFVSRGVEAYSFEPPASPQALAHDERGFVPPALGVRVGQVLRLKSADGRLHTLLAKKVGGTWVRNVPITGGGETQVTFDEPVGAVALECKVHGAAEAVGVLAILDHPLWAVADAGGKFALEGVPPGEGELTAVSPGAAPLTVAYRVADGQRSEVALK